jgi:hypothetical protein
MPISNQMINKTLEFLYIFIKTNHYLMNYLIHQQTESHQARVLIAELRYGQDAEYQRIHQCR